MTSYHIISYHIISYHIISYHITSYHIISYHIISYHIISYHIISHHIISHHITSYHITSYHITSHHIISYHITSYHIISHHITSYLITLYFDLLITLYYYLHNSQYPTVPLASNAADVLEKIIWLKSHPKEAQQLAENAHNFGASYLRLEDYYCYMASALEVLGENLDPTALVPFNLKSVPKKFTREH